MAQVKINKHGYEIKNLREIAGMTKGLGRGTYHLEIAYNREEGIICIEEHVGTVGNNWTKWKEGTTPIGYLTKKTTQQEIADMIAERLG